MIAPILNGHIWRLMFNVEYGPVNHLLSLIGIEPIVWFTDKVAARAADIIADIWLTTPFVVLILLAGLQNISDEVLEAGEIDGASRMQSVRHIIIPMLSQPIMVILILRTMDAFRAFDLMFLLTRGGPGDATMPVMLRIWYFAFTYFEMHRAATAAVVLTIFLLIISAGYYWFFSRRDGN
jgi:multiple sugar transport system permease protein